MWQLFCFILFAVFIICLVVGVKLIIGIIDNGLGENAIDKIISILLLLLFFIATALIFKLFVRLEHNNIHLTHEKIFMYDDWSKKKDKIQYYTEIKYVDIESVDIIWTKKNSIGNNIESLLFSSMVIKPYLSIKNKNGEIANFFVMYVSKRDVTKMVKEIGFRMKEVGNDIDIISSDEVCLKLSRKASNVNLWDIQD